MWGAASPRPTSLKIMLNLLLIFIISLSCSTAFDNIKNVHAFTADFEEIITSPALGKGTMRGKIWFKNGMARINIYSPDTEVILVRDSTIKTINFADSTMIIQKKTEQTEFFFNLIRNARLSRVKSVGDTCFALIKPEIETIDSIYFKFDKVGNPLVIKLFQARTTVGVRLQNFRTKQTVPDSLFRIKPPEGFQTINF